MGSNPINLAVRFLLEVAGLSALGWWGWLEGDGALRYVLALGLPAIAALVWGLLTVPGDPSRSGKAPVEIPGTARLVLEVAFFVVATWALVASGAVMIGYTYGIVAAIHNAVSYDRLLWLIRMRTSEDGGAGYNGSKPTKRG
jgi:hypothetical protein